jgi:hypothetical protein
MSYANQFGRVISSSNGKYIVFQDKQSLFIEEIVGYIIAADLTSMFI